MRGRRGIKPKDLLIFPVYAGADRACGNRTPTGLPSKVISMIEPIEPRPVAVVVPQSFRNTFYSRVAEALDLHATDAGLEPTFFCLNNKFKRVENVLPLLAAGGFKGVIAAPIYDPHLPILDQLEKQQQDRGRPFAAMGAIEARRDDTFIQLPDLAVGQTAVDFLKANGHEIIAFLGAAIGEAAGMVPHSIEGGVVGRMNELRVMPHAQNWFFDAMDDGNYVAFLAAAGKFAQKWLQTPADRRPTAIIGKNDQAAMAILAVCHDNDINVPEQLSVIGYDNLLEGAVTGPALTSVDGRIDGHARATINCLLKQMGVPGLREVEPSELEPVVVERKSVRSLST